MTALDRACRRAVAAGATGVFGVSLAVAGLVSIRAAAGFLPLALASFLVVAWTLWRSRERAASAATTLGFATHLTLLRGLLVSLVAGFTFVSPTGWVAWCPAALYAAAALTDRADGIVARRLGQVTALGAHLDGAMDALGMLAASLVGVMWGRLPPWYLLLGAGYYVYQAGIWLRVRIGRPVFEDRVRPKRATRWFAGAQMVLIVLALSPVLSVGLTTALATVLMVPTLALFVRDWLIVIGRVSAPAPAPTVPPGTRPS